MKKAEIARQIAEDAGLTEAEAADQLDRIVSEMLTKLRHGRAAALPGLGRFRQGADGQIRFERAGGTRRG
jgi:nucleoid DNA-binding protein